VLERRGFFIALAAVLTLTGVGVVGYRLIEGYSWLDSAYMTVNALSTVGFGEVAPLSRAGKLFTTILIVVGFGIVLTVVGIWARSILEGEIQTLLGRRRFQRMLSNISGHYILCGYGRFGRRVAEELAQRKARFVVVDRSVPIPVDLLGTNADATQEDVLVKLGVERAKGILITFDSDADNLFVTLTARELNPNLVIVSRCESEANEIRLRRAGATQTVSTYHTGGNRMAQAALHPRVLDFVDIVTNARDKRMSLAEISVAGGSVCDGVSVREADLGRRFGVVILGVTPEGGSMEIGATLQRTMKEGDVLLAFGDEESLDKLAAAASQAA